MHDYHPGLDNYNELHIWHDECLECESRGKELKVWTLDKGNTQKMIERAERHNKGEYVEMSKCEVRLLEIISWAIKNQ